MTMTESYIETGSRGVTSFVGPDATHLFQAVTLRSSLRLYAKIGMFPTRGVTITRMLALATQFTGKTYKRGQAEKAAADVSVWIEAMKCAIPIVPSGSIQ